VTVGLSFTPAAVVTVQELRAARRLRGRPARGIAGLRGMAVPVLEGTLEHALDLAASMDARGYGRHRRTAGPAARVADGVTVIGLFALAGGIFGVLDQSGAPRLLGPAGLGVGVVALVGGLVGRGRRTARTRYRPDRWGAAATATLAGAVVVGWTFVLRSAGLHPGTDPVVAPGLPILPALALVAALVPVLVTRAPPRPGDEGGSSQTAHRGVDATEAVPTTVPVQKTALVERAAPVRATAPLEAAGPVECAGPAVGVAPAAVDSLEGAS
jgi:energy-coupling factor transport system permease protein